VFYEKAILKENCIILQKYFLSFPLIKTKIPTSQIRNFVASTESHTNNSGGKSKHYILKIDSKKHNQVSIKNFFSYSAMIEFTEKVSEKYALKWVKSEW